MMKPEFEEPEYEGILYNQLSCGHAQLWSPGRVFEYHIGIDYAVCTDNPALWDVLGYTHPLRGACLSRYNWNFIWRTRRRRQMPNFMMNLFIQTKRADYHPRAPRAAAKKGLSSPCWGFDTEAHQQRALEKVQNKVASRAVVCYAAPVFHRCRELFKCTRLGNIIQNSTFPKVSVLRNHRRWLYNKPGATGVAESEPERIEGVPFDEMLRGMVAEASHQPAMEASESLRVVSESIESALHDESLEEDARRSRFFELRRELYGFGNEPEVAPAFLSYLGVVAFLEAYNMEWFVVGE